MIEILASEDASIPAAKSRDIFNVTAEQGRAIEVRCYDGYDHSMRLAQPLRQRAWRARAIAPYA